MDHRGADLVTDRVHALVVGLLQRVVVVGGVGGVSQLGGQAGLRQRLLDHGAVKFPALVVMARAQRGVQRQHHVRSELLLGGDAHTDRSPAAREHLLVVVGQLIAARVQHGQRHHVPADADVADLLDLEHPAGGDPRERAERVEPEPDLGGGGRCGLRSSHRPHLTPLMWAARRGPPVHLGNRGRILVSPKSPYPFNVAIPKEECFPPWPCPT